VLYAVTKLNSVDVSSLCSFTVHGIMSLSSVVCVCLQAQIKSEKRGMSLYQHRCLVGHKRLQSCCTEPLQILPTTLHSHISMALTFMLQGIKIIKTTKIYCRTVNYSYTPEDMYVSTEQIQIPIY
jgi:hypothetical protein